MSSNSIYKCGVHYNVGVMGHALLFLLNVSGKGAVIYRIYPNRSFSWFVGDRTYRLFDVDGNLFCDTTSSRIRVMDLDIRRMSI